MENWSLFAYFLPIFGDFCLVVPDNFGKFKIYSRLHHRGKYSRLRSEFQNYAAQYNSRNNAVIINHQTTSGNWIAVKPAIDLETTPLEINTNSTIGSADKISVIFFNSRGDLAGGVWISFYSVSTPFYFLPLCSSYASFPSTLPTAVDKVWRISLNKTSDITLQIHCNDVEVLDFLLSDDTCSYSSTLNSDWDSWRYYWSKDVEWIRFPEEDTASDYYRLHQQGNRN